MKLIYSICILVLLASCSSQLVTGDSQYTQYTFGVATQVTRAVALTEDEKKIENIFIALYDDAGQLIEHKVVNSIENINFSILTSVTPTTVYVIANTECDYIYQSGNQIIDFSNDEALKIYFASLGNQNQITLSHKTDSKKEFIITRKTPLPMVGSSAIASSGRTTVTVKMAVARVDIINSNPLQSINAIQISGLTNSAVLTPDNKDKQNLVNDSKIKESFVESQIDRTTYYTPTSYTDHPIDISIDYTDRENSIQNFSKSLNRLLCGSYYVVTLNQTDRLSVDVISLKFDPGSQQKQVTIDANVPWEIISTSGKFRFSTLGGLGKTTVTITSSINNSTTPIEENIVIRKLGDPTISATINITQRGVNYAFMPNDVEMVFESGASGRTLTIDRAVTMKATTIGNSTGVTWIQTRNTAADLQEVYTITVDANRSGARETTLIVRDNVGSVIRRISIKQKSGIPRPSIILKAGNTTLDHNTLNVAAIKSQTALELTQQQIEGDILTFKMRYAGGTVGDWWRMKHYASSISQDEIWHNRPGLQLVVDENFGEQRSVDVEVYDKDSPVEPYKSFTITQASAVDYFSLSANSLNLDLWGNVYFQPYELEVKTNKKWAIEPSYAKWITVSYDPNALTGNVSISVKKNGTGTQRSTLLKFISNGLVVKEFPITQSANENSTFNINYKLDLEFNTHGDRFRATIPTSGQVIYASRLEIADNHASDDKIVKFSRDAFYGYVVDAPNSFNKVVANGLTDPAFYIKGYRGQQVSIGTNDMVIGGLFSWSFNRLIRFYLPFPAGVKPDEIVVFKVVVNNLTLQNTYDTPIITHVIERQVVMD